jgi:hypothetical protein
MDMGLKGVDKLEAACLELLDVQLDIALDRVDEYRLTRLRTAEQIGEGRGFGLEELFEFHVRSPDGLIRA